MENKVLICYLLTISLNILLVIGGNKAIKTTTTTLPITNTVRTFANSQLSINGSNTFYFELILKI